MGIKHLKVLRNFLEDNRDMSFSITYLRDTFRDNFNTVRENLDYLIDVEKVVEKAFDDKRKIFRYRWRNV